uniref:NADPH adrenodoxin oxidoreductase n=1 Tax=Arundo donax TaxID=35708 RepID=A0A0A9EFL5_ARUDO
MYLCQSFGKHIMLLFLLMVLKVIGHLVFPERI